MGSCSTCLHRVVVPELGIALRCKAGVERPAGVNVDQWGCTSWRAEPYTRVLQPYERIEKFGRLTDLRAQLRMMREHHISAWREYGSELSAGEMIRKERDLEGQIEELEDELRKAGSL